MTTLLIIVGIIAVALILLGAVALCRAAAMGDEAMRRWEQDMALRERLPETDGEGWKIHHNTVVKNPRAGFLIYDPDRRSGGRRLDRRPGVGVSDVQKSI